MSAAMQKVCKALGLDPRRVIGVYLDFYQGDVPRASARFRVDYKLDPSDASSLANVCKEYELTERKAAET